VIRRLLSRVRHLRPLWSDGFVRLQRSRRSIAAVEFALCAPMLVILLIGTLEILLLYRTEAKLNTLAGNFAQMVANQEVATVSAGITAAHSPVPSTGSSPESLSDLCHGVVDGLQPFPPNGLGVNVASVTQVTATPTYDEWEVDLDSTCAPTGSQAIGVNGTTGARTIARGNGGSTALVHTVGDNAIIVRASLTYPGLIGLILTSNQTMTQTAIARWRYAATTNVTNPGNTPPPSATLEFACSGTGCITNNGV
jgi:hypothetical protein